MNSDLCWLIILHYILFSFIQLSPITTELSNNSKEGPLLPVGKLWTNQPKYKLKQTLLFLFFKKLYIYLMVAF